MNSSNTVNVKEYHWAGINLSRVKKQTHTEILRMCLRGTALLKQFYTYVYCSLGSFDFISYFRLNLALLLESK